MLVWNLMKLYYISGGMSSIENQSAIQSILESQTALEHATTQGMLNVHMHPGLVVHNNMQILLLLTHLCSFLR
mgnify:CR=1 FL=1